jgi:hypothetical protein
MAIASSALPASDVVARIGDHFRPADPEQRLVFHDENDWPSGC